MDYCIGSNKLILKFRITTLVFSTALFIFDKSQMYNFWNNFIVIVCLAISNALLMYFFYDTTLTENKILLLIFLEAIGMIFILGFSGMIYSYYFWMWLNPVVTNLIKTKDKKKKSIVNLILMTTVIILLILNEQYIKGDITSDNINVILGFFITVIFSSMLSKILQQQEIIKRQLKKSKEILEKNLKVNKEIITNIINSIELTERLSVVEEYDEMIEIIIEFFNSVIKRGRSFFAIEKDNDELVVHSNLLEENSIRVLLQQYSNIRGIKEINIDKNTVLIFNSVKYREGINYFGVFVSNEQEIIDVVKQQLIFIEKLYKIVYSKIKLQELKKEFLISEEQNRIAEEMHDNVNQQIFAISCLAFNIKEKIEGELKYKNLIGKMVEQLYNSLRKINKDIKNIVYKMSIEKENKENTITNLGKYIDELSFIYNVKINHKITEEFPSLAMSVKNHISRIINESISNAVRHGRANEIDIVISYLDKIINILISDNGIGFEVNKLNVKKAGLGINSMKRISKRYKGSFKITSQVSKGTFIEIKLLME